MLGARVEAHLYRMTMAAVSLMPIHVSRVPKGCDTWDLEGSSCRPVLVGRAMMQGRRDGDRESGPVAVFPPASGRAAAMPRLLDLDSRGELSAAHVRLMAKALGKSERTVWRWLAAARKDHRLARVEAPHFTVTTEVRRLLTLWGGNASRVHAELVQRAADDPNAPAVPSLSTLHRAIRRDLTRGERAGLKSGEAARRAHDVFGQRPPTHRNATWEGNHKHVPVEVDVEGELATPWVTWFIDCATKAITGAAVTAHAPSRDAVLASLQIAITRSEPFGPVGGLPGQIRVDRGKEFLCATVTAAMGALAVPVTDLPAYTPHLKGSIEALNDAVEEMFLVSLPRYTGRQKLTGGRLADPDAPPLAYEAFVGLLLDWVTWWNTLHRPAALNGKPPSRRGGPTRHRSRMCPSGSWRLSPWRRVGPSKPIRSARPSEKDGRGPMSSFVINSHRSWLMRRSRKCGRSVHRSDLLRTRYETPRNLRCVP
ncbi:hypothetical protein ACIO02_35655 [Streptomyces sp. NPDC087568]|uniref:hypothetical protein n=1 Tax=Streptomyces sp. NPDC087568 TaxID=3365799 RepID=UPI00381166E9